MMRWLGSSLTALALAAAIASSADGGRGRLVFCAPGYPGSTAEAQPAMDAFASALAGGRIEPVYHASEMEGVEAVRAADTRFAVVSFPFYVAYRESLHLTPRLQAVPRGAQ